LLGRKTAGERDRHLKKTSGLGRRGTECLVDGHRDRDNIGSFQGVNKEAKLKRQPGETLEEVTRDLG